MQVSMQVDREEGDKNKGEVHTVGSQRVFLCVSGEPGLNMQGNQAKQVPACAIKSMSIEK